MTKRPSPAASGPAASAPGPGAKGPRKGLPIIVNDDDDGDALIARFPDAVNTLSDEERHRRVRMSATSLPEGFGGEVVLLDDPARPGGAATRAFVRATLRVPLGHPRAMAYGVYVEVDRAGYERLQRAHRGKTPARVTGTLATRLPYLDAAFGADVEVVDDGGAKRARVVDSANALLRNGPSVGPMDRR